MNISEGEGEYAVFSHVTLCVSNLSRSIAFYECLGFIRSECFEVGNEISPLIGIEPPIKVESVFMRKQSYALDLMYFDAPGATERSRYPINTTGLVNMAFRVDCVDKMVSMLTTHGGRAIYSECSNDVGRFRYVEDPDGVKIEIFNLADGVLDIKSPSPI